MSAKAKKVEGKNQIISFIKDDRIRLLTGLLLVLFSAFMLFAFISYLFTWRADQSFAFGEVLSDASIRADNWAGKSGARLANLFISKWFGVSALAIPFVFGLIGLSLLNVKLGKLGRLVRLIFISVILGSLTTAFVFSPFKSFLGSGFGGYHGLVITEWLNAVLGKVGTGFVLFILIITFLVFSFQAFWEWLKIVLTAKQKTEIDTEEKITAETDTEKEVEPNPDNTDLTFEIERLTESADAVIPDHVLLEDDVRNSEEDMFKEADEDVEETEEEEGNAEVVEGDEDVFDESSLGEYDPTLDLSEFRLPPIDLLDKHEANNIDVTDEELISNKKRIVQTLADYKIQIKSIKATIGPTVTLYEIVPEAGVRISKIKNLEDDIALSISAIGIRIIAPIPGKGTIGIEVPNQTPQIVSMRSVLSSPKFVNTTADLAVAIGKTIQNETFVFDLAKMPHLLVAGATSMGKSVGLNCIITSLLYKKHPSDLKFVFIDPKKVELTMYSKLDKHYLAKLPDDEEAIYTDTKKVINVLNSLCILMDSRYDLLKKAHVKNIKEYNVKFKARKLNPNHGHYYMCYIVVVIDEFADLISTAGKEIETPLARLAQVARAIGVHLIVATQRPSANIITGVIKANFPSRIAFRVSSMIDSRTILDSPGANQLIGRGDMLITAAGADLIRIQCAFIDTPEIERLTEFISSQQHYPECMLLPEFNADENSLGEPEAQDNGRRDELFEEAARLIVGHQQGSTSLIQRKFAIGYNRAGRIMDQLERVGVVGAFEGSKARKVLYPDMYTLEKFLNELSGKGSGN